MHEVFCCISKEIDLVLDISFIKNMRDEGYRKRVSFNLKNSPNFTFTRVLTVVKAAYWMIGEVDPFNPKSRFLNDKGA